jgi:hypothetical protein
MELGREIMRLARRIQASKNRIARVFASKQRQRFLLPARAQDHDIY